MDQEQPMPDQNLVIYAFLRKTIGLTSAIRVLVGAGFENEAQILARALIETRINFEYFLDMAKEDYKNVTGRVFASLILDKMKALRATNFMLGDQQVDREKWEGIEKQIRESCGEKIFDELKRFGFSGVSLEARAARTGNEDLYHMAYRMYSRNAYATDIHEQLGRKLVGEVLQEQNKLYCLRYWQLSGIVRGSL